MTNFFLDGIEIQQRLCGMLPRAIPGVDEGDRTHARRTVRAPGLRVPHGNNVDVLTNNDDGVFNSFPFVEGTELESVRSHHIAAETMHGRLEAKPRTRAWFVEETCEYLPL